MSKRTADELADDTISIDMTGDALIDTRVKIRAASAAEFVGWMETFKEALGGDAGAMFACWFETHRSTEEIDELLGFLLEADREWSILIALNAIPVRDARERHVEAARRRQFPAPGRMKALTRQQGINFDIHFDDLAWLSATTLGIMLLRGGQVLPRPMTDARFNDPRHPFACLCMLLAAPDQILFGNYATRAIALHDHACLRRVLMIAATRGCELPPGVVVAAAACGNATAISLLRVNDCVTDGPLEYTSALCCAIRANDTHVLTELLRSPTCTLAKGPFNALDVAAAHGRTIIMKLLTTDDDFHRAWRSSIALQIAQNNEHTEMCEVLVAATSPPVPS